MLFAPFWTLIVVYICSHVHMICCNFPFDFVVAEEFGFKKLISWQVHVFQDKVQISWQTLEGALGRRRGGLPKKQCCWHCLLSVLGTLADFFLQMFPSLLAQCLQNIEGWIELNR